jgi:hypothetical protein
MKPSKMASIRVFDRHCSATIYSVGALREAQVAYAEHCAVTIDSQDPHRPRVTIQSNSTMSDEQWREIVLEFWNYILDATAQVKG